jgi:diguanylate cyclase (GGDEF)-like protein
VEDVAGDFRFSADEIASSREVFRSLIETPLISENKIIGVLRMDNARELVYTQDDLRLLDIIANLGAVAIQNAFLYSRTQELATRDGLTGLVVRRYFMERFREEIKRSEINGSPLSLVLLDIDHFKDYNDRYGHAAGDIVLKHLAKTISSAARDSGIVVRYGGEEIAVLMCGKGKKEAVTESEKIRKAVINNPLTFRRRDAKITVSIGLASYPDEAMTEEELIKVADSRLYKAKAEGRDRVVSC